MPPKPGEIWWRRYDTREERSRVHYVSNFDDKTAVCGIQLEGGFMNDELVTCATCVLTATTEKTTGPARRGRKSNGS